jgi:hypothetical protein
MFIEDYLTSQFLAYQQSVKSKDISHKPVQFLKNRNACRGNTLEKQQEKLNRKFTT